MVAIELGISRSTINSYENGSVQNPTLEALVSFSKFFKMSLDTLVKIDLSRVSEFQLSELERGHDVFVTGAKLRVLATTVDSNNKENIEVVPIKAKAGYKSGYADPDFIKKLPTVPKDHITFVDYACYAIEKIIIHKLKLESNECISHFKVEYEKNMPNQIQKRKW
jgi:transcriptional regulator with XRE-family HTH domain